MTVDKNEVRVLCNAIISYRGRHNLTQGEFAGLCGLSRATIVTIESGGLRRGRSGITALTKSKILNVIESEGL